MKGGQACQVSIESILLSMPSSLDLIERIGQLIRFEQREIGVREDLHPIHIQVLQYLDKCNRYSDTPLAISHYLGSTKGTISQSILVLEKKQLVKKITDSKDKRVIHLKLTTKAKKLLHKIDEQIFTEDLLNKYSNHINTTVNKTLKAILKDLQKRNNYRTFGQCSSCRFFTMEEENKFRCGLTLESLKFEETLKICVEHEATD